jgi:hypothetical protein
VMVRVGDGMIAASPPAKGAKYRNNNNN